MIFSKSFVIIILLALTTFFITSSHMAFAENPPCDWISEKNLSIHNNKIVFKVVDNQTVPLKFDCNFSEPQNLENKLINLELQVEAAEKYSLTFSLIDSSGNKVSSPSIMEWYGIPPNKTANISLDPIDLINDSKSFHLDKTMIFEVESQADNIQSLQISNLTINTIESHPNFSLSDNLPVESTIPGFLSIILISFPLGYITLTSSGFLRDHNIVLKIPWILGFGFIVYLIFAYIVSLFWISFEVVSAYVIAGYILMMIFLFKKRPRLENFKSERYTLIFFSVLIVSSSLLSLSVAQMSGWPIDNEDTRIHAALIDITMANHKMASGNSYLPIRDMDFIYSQYPKGSHVAAAGVSFFSNTFPATTIVSIYAFTLFLIPLMFSSFVYKFTRSIFFSVVMFMLTYWQSGAYWEGDPIVNTMLGGLFSARVAYMIILTCFMLIIALLDNANKKWSLFTLFAAGIAALTISYYAFTAIPIFIAAISLIAFYVKGKKKTFLIFSGLVLLFASFPIWTKKIFEKTAYAILYENTGHSKYLLNHPFDPGYSLFPYWISSAIGIVCAFILVREKKYRTISIIVITVSMIQFLSIPIEISDNYFFYIQYVRSLGLMFFFSIIINLIMISLIITKASQQRIFSKFSNSKKMAFKIAGILSIGILLVPSAYDWYGMIQPSYWIIVKIPGGNERNLQYWLYNNASSNDLILNDQSEAAQWFIGFRAQNIINSEWQNMEVSRGYNDTNGLFEPKDEPSMETLQANQILKNPWDYQYIDKTIKELKIKYVYISERDYFQQKCMGSDNSCYPDSKNWPWHKFSGNARVAMYENNPDLKLMIRNGNSAVFKVVNID